MKNYTMEELRNDLEGILRRAVVDDEAAMVQIDKNLKAVIISEAEWNMLCDGLAMLVGGTRIGSGKKR